MRIGKRATTVLLGVAVSVTLVGGVLTGCDLDTTQNYSQNDSVPGQPGGSSSLTGPERSTGVQLPDTP